MPDFTQALIAELIEVGGDAVRRGLVLASAGNLSARVPDRDCFVVTAAGTWFDRLVPGSFALIDMGGRVIGGNPRPSTEWKLHWRTYQVRPDVNAVMHLHPQTAVMLDALGHRIQLLTLDHAFYLGSVERVPFFHNASDALADASAEASRSCNAVIQAHHGSSTLGETIEMAYRRALNLEDAATTTFRCLQLGRPDATFPPEALEELRHL
jgi:L-fuculose-phosphate aldolase